MTKKPNLGANPSPEYFGDGIHDCRGCGAALGDARFHPQDADGRYWQAFCFKNLRCETCGGAKTRLWGKEVRCLYCTRPTPWIDAWSTVSRQAAMDHLERQRRARTWPIAWTWVWGQLEKAHEAQTAMWADNFGNAWKVIAPVHLRWIWWSRKWLKQWGRLGAHHRRRVERFANPAAWGDEDPVVRRFAQLEWD